MLATGRCAPGFLELFLYKHLYVSVFACMHVCACVCVCVCLPLRLLITSGVMWHMDHIQLVKQVLQCSCYREWAWPWH